MAQTINVNTTPGQFMPTLYYSQGDIGREFEIVLASSDGWSIPAGATVEMVATKPSGFGFTVSGTLSDNTATFVTTETMTNEWGRFPAEVRISSSGDVIGTANFYLSGERDPHPEETIDGDAEEIIPELTLLVERVEAAASSVLDMTVVANTLPAGSDATYSYDEETNTATFGIPKGADGSLASGVLAPTYSSSSTYAVGDYVYYSGNLYRCTTAITTAEAWTSGHWTQVAIAPEVSDVKSDFNVIADIKRNYFNPADALSGYYYDGTVGNAISANTNTNYACIIFPVEKGKTYVLSRTDYRWNELDENNIILDRHGSGVTATELSITPNTTGVKKVAISWQKAYVSIADYMILDSGVSFSNYIPYPYKDTLTQSVIDNTGIVTEADIDVSKADKVMDEFSVIYNYFNPETALSGKFYNGNAGDTIYTGDNDSYACYMFPVEKGKTYVLDRTDYTWYEVDENNKILYRHGSGVTANHLSITPNETGVKKVAISWNKNNLPIASYMILDSGVSFSEYIPYPYVTKMSANILEASSVQIEKVYTVGSGGDYTTFSDMLVALKNDASKKTVYVQTGIYDIFTEMGGQAYIESIDVDDGWLVANNIVPPNTKIVGVGDVVLQYKPTDTQIVDYAHGWLISPLNITDSCEIENIAVDASNCRYAIHIESASGGYDVNTANIKLKNVRAHRAVTTLMGDHQTVGTGIGHNAKWEFDNCRFTSDGTSAVFSVHTNAPASNSKASVIFRDCVIDTSHDNNHNHKLMNFISAYLPVAITNIANVANCYVGGTIGTETSITNRQSFDIDVIGGASYGFADSTTQTSGYTINNCGNNILT